MIEPLFPRDSIVDLNAKIAKLMEKMAMVGPEPFVDPMPFVDPLPVY